MSRPLTAFESELRQTAADILPHVKSFYLGYVKMEQEPYYRYNSKK